MQERRKVYGEIIPQTVGQFGDALQQNISAQVAELNARFEAEATKVIGDQEKALAELTKNLELETAAKPKKLSDIAADLNIISKFI